MSLVCPSIMADRMPALCRAVDMYCERTSAAVFDEPLNALSNVGFLIAGIAAWRLASAAAPAPHPSGLGVSPAFPPIKSGVRQPATPRPEALSHRGRGAQAEMSGLTSMSSGTGDAEEHRGNQWLVGALIATMFAIGIGSFLFHTLGTAWAALFDVIPIFVFMLVMLWLALTRFFAWPAWAAAIALVGFVLAGAIVSALPIPLPAGGAGYLPALVTLFAVSLALARRRSKAAPLFLVASGVFLVSFAARTIDLPACGALPSGTHFVWHILNAVVLYLLVRAVILYAPARLAQRSATS